MGARCKDAVQKVTPIRRMFDVCMYHDLERQVEPIVRAAGIGHPGVVEYLLAYGVDINFQQVQRH
jgi:hypothetical protein